MTKASNKPKRTPGRRLKNPFNFSPAEHFPKYSKYLFQTLRSPVVIYIILVGNLILTSSILIFYNYEVSVNPRVEDMFDALWWGITTVTTVGYGDLTPVTAPGRIVGMGLMIMGVLFFVSFSALFSSILFAKTAEAGIQERAILEQLKILNEKIENLENNKKS